MKAVEIVTPKLIFLDCIRLVSELLFPSDPCFLCSLTSIVPYGCGRDRARRQEEEEEVHADPNEARFLAIEGQLQIIVQLPPI